MRNAEETEVIAVSAVTKTIVTHHLTSFQDNDLKGVMSDYSHHSVLITQDATYKGLKEIESFLGGLMLHFPKGKSNIDLDKMIINDDLGYIVWHAKTPTLDVSFGSDTFIIKGGKIHQQTFAGLLTFFQQ